MPLSVPGKYLRIFPERFNGKENTYLGCNQLHSKEKGHLTLN